ncbi:MAG: glycosyltransferase family 2 protein [Ruminococcus sp.]|nr:glycosyltransferase family 2 protein [Ruminococcus sp.]
MPEINHTFVICAYKESPYLDEAVRSVMDQTVKSNVVISTSTPNEYIKSVAEKCNIAVQINRSEDAMTMGGDWSFGYESASTDYVTIAHQDDIYDPTYTESVLKAARGKNPIIIFTDYFELRNGQKVYKNKLLTVKKIMNTGFKLFPSSRFARRRVLSLGCPICCPSVTFYKPVCGDFKFNVKMVNNLDWDAWIRLSDKKGKFIYINKPLMGHRIHTGSFTTQYIENGARHNETMEVFMRFWPEWFAKRLIKIYETGDKSNQL